MSPSRNDFAHSRPGRLLVALLLALLLLLLPGCRGGGGPGSTALLGQIHGLEVEEARLGESEALLRVRAVFRDGWTSRTLYARFGWTREDEPVKRVEPIWTMSEEDWEYAAAGLPALRVLDQAAWLRVENATFDGLVPLEPYRGVLVVLDPAEWVVYHDASGVLRVSDLEVKPANVVLERSVEVEDIRHRILAQVEALLASRGIASRAVLFATDPRDGAPFALADLDRELLVLTRTPFDTAGQGKDPFAELKVAEHLFVGSPLSALLNRPFSTLHRGLRLGAGNVADLADPRRYPVPRRRVSPPPVDVDAEPMDPEAFESELERITGDEPGYGRLALLIDGGEYFPRMLEEILAARRRVFMRTFVFASDDYAYKVADVLKQRSAEVDVRVLLDGLGTLGQSLVTPPTQPADFVTREVVTEYLQQDADVAVRVQANPLGLADHVKITAIDGKVAFVGGMNVGREYRYEWHDLMMEARGPIAADLEDEFLRQWYLSGPLGDVRYPLYRLRGRLSTPPEREEGDYPIRILQTRPGLIQIYRAQLAALRAARRQVLLENPYFADESFAREVIAARRRGVDVRVILPVRSNHQVMAKSNVVMANRLFANGVRVYLYPRMSHTKAAIYDGWACLGSANFDRLSFRNNRELNLATFHPPFVEALRQRLFEADFEASYEMTEPLPADWSNYLAKKLADRL